jgi:hypothetical protein
MRKAAAAYFSQRYAPARAQFLASCRAQGAQTTSHVLADAAGPDGEALAVDIARLGARDARAAVVIISGTHGIEGYCGSALQSAWLDAQPGLPSDCTVVLVHALNAHGMAWWSRTDQDNIDLNRNFLPFPVRATNPGYRALHATICPSDWSEQTRAAIKVALAQFEAGHGKQALTDALIASQGDFPDGMNYCGTRASWSRGVLQAALEALAGEHPDRVVLLDLHTGVAPMGEVALLHFPLDADDAVQGRRVWHMPHPWFHFGAPGLANYSGLLVQDARTRFGPSWHCAVAEIGTVDRERIREALRLDRFLRFQARGELAQYRQELLEVFCPSSAAWQQQALDRGCALIDHAVASASR